MNLTVLKHVRQYGGSIDMVRELDRISPQMIDKIHMIYSLRDNIKNIYFVSLIEIMELMNILWRNMINMFTQYGYTRTDFPLKKWRKGYKKSEYTPYELLKRAENRLIKARTLITSDLYDEAGEEAWRATMDAINALSTFLWGYEIKSHRGFSVVVEELALKGIIDIRTEYGNAAALHSNYFDPHLGKETVKANIEQVNRLIEKIKTFILINSRRIPLNIIVEITFKLLVNAPLLGIKTTMPTAMKEPSIVLSLVSSSGMHGKRRKIYQRDLLASKFSVKLGRSSG